MSENITKIPAPRTPLIDQNSGDMTPAWYRFFYNIFITLGEGSGILPTTRGGTGQSIYANGELLIGNSVTGSLNKNTLTPLGGIQVVNGPGTITIENTGVTSLVAGPGIDVDVAVGDITISNTGVLSFSGGATGLTPSVSTTGAVVLAGTLDVNNGGTGQTSYTNGQLLIGNTTGNTLTKSTLTAGSGVAITNGAGAVAIDNTGVLSISGGTTGLTPSIATTGAVTLAGTLAVINGGTGQTSYTDGQLLIGNTTGNTLTKATLTAGTGISIANSAGAITITNTSPSSGGTVTSVGFTGGIISVATPTTTPAFTVAGTSGGIPYFSSATTWATSAALAANALVIGGGAGVAPSTTTTGTGVVTALGVNTGTTGAFVVNGGALGTPSGGTVTNLTGTASININGTVGATTANTGAFTTLTCTSTLDTGSLARNAGRTANTTITNQATFTTGGLTLASQTAAIGSTWRITAFGQFTAASSGTVRTAQVACFWGTTQLTAITPTVLASTAQTTQWQVEFTLTASSTTAIWTAGTLISRIASTTALAVDNATPASTAVTSGAQTLDLRFRVSSAIAAESWIIQSATMERVE